LQLLEFLIKNGSERVVDYARSHSAVIDMLKHFHYIDNGGRDQGINIRNRAKLLTELLNDVEKIRQERKKARSNKTKYGGIGSEVAGLGGSGKKYGGFGSETLEYGGDYNPSGVFGDGGGFNGSNYSGPGYSNHDGDYDEDDEFEEYKVETEASSSTGSSQKKKSAQANKPFSDFISFDDDAPAAVANSSANANYDDDFDDFQSATPESAGATTSPKAATNLSNSAALSDLFSSVPAVQQSTTPSISSTTFSPQLSSSTLQSPTSPFGATFSQTTHSAPISASTTSTTSATFGKPAKANDAFGDLWSNASSKSKKPAKPSTNTSLSSLAQESAKNSMWNAQPTKTTTTSNNNNNNNNDLLSF
jgi:epsin